MRKINKKEVYYILMDIVRPDLFSHWAQWYASKRILLGMHFFFSRSRAKPTRLKPPIHKMKTDNNTLHTQLVALFEQHPYLTSLSHDEENLIFPTDYRTLTIHLDQVERINTLTDKVIITLCNEIVHTLSLSTDEVRVTLPPAKE